MEAGISGTRLASGRSFHDTREHGIMFALRHDALGWSIAVPPMAAESQAPGQKKSTAGLAVERCQHGRSIDSACVGSLAIDPQVLPVF